MSTPAKPISKQAILQQLAIVRDEITLRLADLKAITPHDREDPVYAERVIDYVEAVELLRREQDKRFKSIAEHISKLAGKDWQRDKEICQIWLEFAHTVELLRHNPNKGPACVYVSADNKLIAYSAANFWLEQMLPSHKFKAKWVTMETRRHANICAERKCIADTIGHGPLKTNEILRRPKTNTRHVRTKIIRLKSLNERMAVYTRRLIANVSLHNAFTDSTLITTADPCGHCAPVVAASGVTTLIGGKDDHDHGLADHRREDIQEARSLLKGLKHIRVSRAAFG